SLRYCLARSHSVSPFFTVCVSGTWSCARTAAGASERARPAARPIGQRHESRGSAVRGMRDIRVSRRRGLAGSCWAKSKRPRGRNLSRGRKISAPLAPTVMPTLIPCEADTYSADGRLFPTPAPRVQRQLSHERPAFRERSERQIVVLAVEGLGEVFD